MSKTSPGPVLHVVVVGFHHKRGCQVEFAYPPLIPGKPADSHETPRQWKHLPSLALPDGAHNYTKDTIYFHLPSLVETDSTVFGISCYRQIDSGELIKRQADVTRNTVQKCVCVLSELPLYGLLQAKLEMITHAYFKERDFSQVSLLEDMYRSLNNSLTPESVHSQQIFLGLSGRAVVQKFRHKILILFKLIMLERRVLFFSSPVESICSTMLTILSLFPGMLEHGLKESASYTPERLLSPTLKLMKVNSIDEEDFLEVHYTSRQMSPTGTKQDRGSLPNKESPDSTSDKNQSLLTMDHSDAVGRCDGDMFDINKITHASVIQEQSHVITTQPVRTRVQSEPASEITKVKSLQRSFSLPEEEIMISETDQQIEDMLEAEECFNWNEDKLLLEIDDCLVSDSDSKSSRSPRRDAEMVSSGDRVSLAACTSDNKRIGSLSRDSSNNSLSSSSSIQTTQSTFKDKVMSALSNKTKSSPQREPVSTQVEDTLSTPSTLVTDEFGFPLAIFTKGNVCHPYLCLQYYDLLSDVNIRGLLIGATNQLFKQKRHLVDVIVEVEDTKMTINDPELRKQLTLSTADLRFADYLVKSVCDARGNTFLEETEWEGGEEWLRGQFRLYLLGLMAAVDKNDDKLIEDFNQNFVSAWKTTHNYKLWAAGKYEAIQHLVPGHPFQGQLSMADMKLRLSHSMQSTEGGKKLNAAVHQTGKAVISTGRAVGGALNTAKSAVSKTVTSWFTGFGSTASQKNTDPQEITSS